MRNWLDLLLDTASFCTSQFMLEEALADLAGRLGFDSYGFVSLRPGQEFACSNAPPEWQKIYQVHGYRNVDPVMRQAKRSGKAFSWSAENYQKHVSNEERRFLAHATEFGISSGITIPVPTPHGGMSVLTLASSRRSPLRDEDIDAVAAAAAVAQLHARFQEVKTHRPEGERFSLSAREARYLQWLTLGKSVEDAADLEGVKYNAVRVVLAAVRQRYNLCNNTQLAALAIREGQL